MKKSRRLQRHYEIGEEITYQPTESVWKSFFSFSGKKAAVMSAAVASLMLFSVVIPNFTSEVSAYMTIDVNPSIELGIDDDLQVVELRGINADGERVISNLPNWKNKDLSDVAERIILKTEELGYFKDSTRKIIVSNTVIDDDKTLEKQLNQEIKGFTNDISANTKVKLIHASEMDRNQAEKLEISTGKYLEQKQEKEKSKHKKSRINRKSDRQRPDQEKKVSDKGEVEKHNNSKNSEPKKVKPIDQKQPVKGKEIESKKTTNGNVKSNSGNKEKPKTNSNSKNNKKNTVNKTKQASKVKSESKPNPSNQGKSEAKRNQERVKGNSETDGKSEDKGNSGNNGKSGDKGNSGTNGNSEDKGNLENKGNPGNNGNGNLGDTGNSENNDNSENKGSPSNNGNGNPGNNSNAL